MENNRGNERPGKKKPEAGQQPRHRKTGAPSGFEGMNFEEQRGSYKNSDGAGVKGVDSKRNHASKKSKDFEK